MATLTYDIVYDILDIVYDIVGNIIGTIGNKRGLAYNIAGFSLRYRRFLDNIVGVDDSIIRYLIRCRRFLTYDIVGDFLHRI